jgi:hypothetical protein
MPVCRVRWANHDCRYLRPQEHCAEGEAMIVTCYFDDWAGEGSLPAPADFSDLASHLVLSATARRLAGEIGRMAAREWFAARVRR